MMRIRPITPNEVAAFAALTPIPEHSSAIHQYLDRMFVQGVMRVDWCFVDEEDDRFLGRLAYWTYPNTDIPSDIVFFDVPWERDYHTIGTQLVLQTLPAMRALGATDLGYVLDSPSQSPQWQSFPEQRHQLLTSLGFQITRETYRFACDIPPVPQSMSKRLRFRTLPEVGTDAFLMAIEEVSIETLDRLIQRQRSTAGPTRAAQMMLSILQGMAYEPAWWQLAYTPDGALVGLVMPTNSLTAGTIGYIGVVPGQRGYGYSYDLLVQGTTTLYDAGVTTIRADTDVGNLPMASTFRRAGYTQIGTRFTYQLKHTT